MITVLGATGFIGSHLVSALRKSGHDPYIPGRQEDLRGKNLGYVYYCIGMTADFRQFPVETMVAHVGKLTEILQSCTYQGLLYLSSSRVYEHAGQGHEDTAIPVRSSDLSDIYTLSKLSGESLCLAQDNPDIKVVRLSNVYGPDWESQNFLISILRSALKEGHVVLGTSAETCKDYISIEDVTEMLPQIANGGQYRLYNLASGIQLSNQQLLDQICQHSSASWALSETARHRPFPAIDISRLQQDFTYHPRHLLNDLDKFVAEAPYQKKQQEQ